MKKQMNLNQAELRRNHREHNHREHNPSKRRLHRCKVSPYLTKKEGKRAEFVKNGGFGENRILRRVTAIEHENLEGHTIHPID